jgi:hypothetical protein
MTNTEALVPIAKVERASERQVIERIQISQLCRLITFADGSAALWLGADRVGLSAYEATRLGYALTNDQQEGKDAISTCSQA